MNRHAYIKAISLLGKLTKKLNLLDDIIIELTREERELLRQCFEEYQFYHGHEELRGASKTGTTGSIGAEMEAGRKRKPGRPPKGL